MRAEIFEGRSGAALTPAAALLFRQKRDGAVGADGEDLVDPEGFGGVAHVVELVESRLPQSVARHLRSSIGSCARRLE